MKIVAFSDTHGDATTAGSPRVEDIERAMDEVVDYAIQNKVDLVVHLGDIADPDSTRVHRAIAHVVEVAMKLAGAGIDNLWIAGNHDVQETSEGTTTFSALYACTEHVEEIAVDEVPRLHHVREKTAIITLPYVARSRAYDPEDFIRKISYAISKEPDIQDVLIFGHLNIEGIGPGSETKDMARGRDIFWPIEAIEQSFKGKRVACFGGHYHQRQIFRGIQVVGSLERIRFDEVDSVPGFLLIEVP